LGDGVGADGRQGEPGLGKELLVADLDRTIGIGPRGFLGEGGNRGEEGRGEGTPRVASCHEKAPW
jgi:hypothetical protein